MESYKQQYLPGFTKPHTKESIISNAANSLDSEDKPFHDWYRFVLSFPAHLVRYYLSDFKLTKGDIVLDPFCGTGTTLVESKLNGLESIGIEAHPFSYFASRVKINWNIDSKLMLRDAEDISNSVITKLEHQGISDISPFESPPSDLSLQKLDQMRSKLLIKNSISPLPLHKCLILLSELEGLAEMPHYDHLRLAFSKALVNSISNLHFGPEVGVGKIKTDSPVIAPWLSEVRNMAKDIESINHLYYPDSTVFMHDAREADKVIPSGSVSAVITSPPYPNEKDYTRTTRLESILLGFINSREDLRRYKKDLVRSNTRGVYKSDTDDEWIDQFPEILEIAEKIEKRRKELGKTSGFERMYHRVTKLYFGGMARHLASMRPILKPGANLAYVVGDQASYLRVMIRTGQLIAKIAEHLGYELVRIDLFRKRFATATRKELREEVVILRWP